MNIFQLIKERSKTWGDNPAIHDEFGTLTYHELINLTETLSRDLKEVGVKEGMALAISTRNSREFIIAILAGLDCGTTVIPLSHKLTQDELDTIFDETKLHVFIDNGNGNGQELVVGARTFRLSFEHPFIVPFAPHVDNPAFMRFTSGTTGKSKGVIISHISVLERIEAANKGLQLGSDDTVIWVLPIAYHFVVSIILYLYHGTTIMLCNDFTARAIIESIREFKGSMLYCSPMHIRLLASAHDQNSLLGLKRVISTSSGSSYELCTEFAKRYGVPVSQAFGIIEVGLPIINFESSAEHPDAVGYVLPDYQVGILDDNLRELPPSEIGQLAIQGPGMFDAYLSPSRTRAEILQNGWFMTGDLASKTPEGLVKIEGRKKSMINVSGNKVFPEEVEAIINSHPSIKTSKVEGKAHPLLGEIVTAEVVLDQGREVEVEDVLSYCRKKLASFKVPQRVKFVDLIQETGSGKVKRV